MKKYSGPITIILAVALISLLGWDANVPPTLTDFIILALLMMGGMLFTLFTIAIFFHNDLDL